jgi:hypothetical protein
MISQHLDKALTPEQRARWVLLLARSAGEVGLPADAEFRAAQSGQKGEAHGSSGSGVVRSDGEGRRRAPEVLR